MFTTFIHIGTISIFTVILSFFGFDLWIWIPAIVSITITIQLLCINSYLRSLMVSFLKQHSEEFNDNEENEIMKISPGVFIPQVAISTSFAKMDLGAALGWARLMSFISVVLGIFAKDYVLLSIGVAVTIFYLFTHIGGMFFQDNPEADMFSSIRRYLSSKKINVKSMSDMELQSYVEKYEEIVTKLKRL